MSSTSHSCSVLSQICPAATRRMHFQSTRRLQSVTETIPLAPERKPWITRSRLLESARIIFAIIHVHHGYFGSSIGMTAARLLNIGFSMTLHGSDLLRNASYLDLKLAQCDFCVTISEYNRNYILQRFPNVDAQK